jgi:hypothetical protein
MNLSSSYATLSKIHPTMAQLNVAAVVTSVSVHFSVMRCKKQVIPLCVK